MVPGNGKGMPAGMLTKPGQWVLPGAWVAALGCGLGPVGWGKAQVLPSPRYSLAPRPPLGVASARLPSRSLTVPNLLSAFSCRHMALLSHQQKH